MLNTCAAPEIKKSQGRIPANLLCALSYMLPLIALAVGFFAMNTAHLSAIGPYGLIQALPPLYYVALGLEGFSFLLSWSISQTRPIRISVDLLVLVLLLQSPPAIIEPVARFASAWLTAGFADYVARTGHVLPNLDARFSWPAFFAGIGMVSRAAGLPSTIILLKWWPVAINLLYLPPFYLLARTILRKNRPAILATWLFPMANWVGQDYFSPQSIACLLYLIFIWVVVDQFAEDRKGLFPVRRRQPNEERVPSQSAISPMLGLTVLAVLGLAMIVGHQITPIFAGLTVTLLAFFGRTRLKVFGILMLLFTAGWICYDAVTFWSGHFAMLAGGLGDLGGNVSIDLATRLRGSPQHYQVLDVRLLLSFLVWGLALLGALVGHRRRQDVRIAAVLMITPFLVLAGGGYGGEAGLRVYLFSLAGALPLVATLFAGPHHARSAIASALVVAVLIPSFVLARWGNELSEMTLQSEITAVRALYRIAPRGATLLSITPQVSWRFSAIDQYNYQPDNLDEFVFLRIDKIVRLLSSNPRGGYVLITTSELVYGEQAYGLPNNWGSRVERAMMSSGHFALLYSNANAKIYMLR